MLRSKSIRLLGLSVGCAGLLHCSPGGDAGDGPGTLGGMAAGGSTGTGSGAGADNSGGGLSGLGIEGQGAAQSGGGLPVDEGCASSTEDGVQIPANLMFVIDRSGSMNCCPPPVTDSATCEIFPVQDPECADSKWDITRDVLIDAIGGLRGLEHLSVGITMFPTDNACGYPTGSDVSVRRLDDAHFATVQSFLDGVVPAGSTPLAGAVMETYASLQSTFQERLRSENTFVVVVSDGADTCAPSEMDRLVEDLAGAALGINIRTFVIGVPGSEPARLDLSKLAYAGGTARFADCDRGQNGTATDAGATEPSADAVCHFDMTLAVDFGAELSETLDAITRSKELSCEFDVPASTDGRPTDRDKVNVTFRAGTGDAESVLQDASLPCDEGAEGWQYSEDGSKIILCGTVCDRVQADPGGRVEIVLGCPTEQRIR
jgi:hypothetical protein